MDINLEIIGKWVNTPFVHIGGSPVTLSGVFLATCIVFGSFMVSAFLRKNVTKTIDKKFKLDKGLSFALERFLHYAIVILGVGLSAQTLGLNLGSLAVIFGFLSVGIGFGLQNVASNFISGIILLLERPVSVGDLITVEGQVGRVVSVNMRSTIIRTMDNVSIIVPNSQLIENQVTNWTTGDSKVRIHCPVGVAYGSDIELVKETLLKVGKSHQEVLDRPEPDVAFLEFGDSSLNMSLRVWTKDPDQQYSIQSDLNYKIDAAFREAGIEIPFPQRDVNLTVTDGLKTLAGASPSSGERFSN